jgi:hypothetical protein
MEDLSSTRELEEAWRLLTHNEGVGVRTAVEQAARKGRLLVHYWDQIPPPKERFCRDVLGISYPQARRYIQVALAHQERRLPLRRIEDIHRAEREGGQVTALAEKAKTGTITRPPAVLSCVQGENCDLIANVAKLYLRPGCRVLDMTYGRGLFWRKIIKADYQFTASDLHTSAWMAGVERQDFRNTTFPDQSFDVAVLDPWYLSSVTSSKSNRQHKRMMTYRQDRVIDTASLMGDHYSAGMREAFRVLVPGGTCWVKCQDTGRRWIHIEVKEVAVGIGFRAIDHFILHQNRPPIPIRSDATQRVARKNHSYLWVFRKV